MVTELLGGPLGGSYKDWGRRAPGYREWVSVPARVPGGFLAGPWQWHAYEVIGWYWTAAKEAMQLAVYAGPSAVETGADAELGG